MPLTATATVKLTCELVGCYGGAALLLELGLHEQFLRQTNGIAQSTLPRLSEHGGFGLVANTKSL